MIRQALVLGILAALLLAGCSRNEVTGNAVDDSVNAADTRTPTQTPTQGSNRGSTPADVPPEVQQCEPVTAQQLAAALPDRVGAYSGGDPQTQTMAWTDPNSGQSTEYSTASVTLGGVNGAVIVALTDTCRVAVLSQAWQGYAAYDTETGFLRQTTLAGVPAWEQYDSASDTYSYNLFVEDHVLVTVQGTPGVPERDVQAAAQAVQYDQLQ
jgi:hypothetical protein